MAKSKPRYGRGTGKPHPVDIHVGARVRMRRTLLGMNQTKLGEELGLTFDVSIEHFFEDMPPEVAASSLATKGRSRMKKLPSYEPNPMLKRETLELVRAYYKIEGVNVRKRVYELTKTLGAIDV